MKYRTTTILVCLLLAFAATAFPQENRFEGNNIILHAPRTQEATACAIRFAPKTASVTVTDIDRSTPMRIRSCAGSGTRVTSIRSDAVRINASAASEGWCFTGEDEAYDIEFEGDQYLDRVKYRWIATPEKSEMGRYNVRDFGAMGDGETDDTLAIRSALAFIAYRNGGVLWFPQGDYIVGRSPGYRPIAIPSGVTIEGVSGLNTGAATNNVQIKSPTRIRLVGSNRALFNIGECTEKIGVRNIELIADSKEGTYGIEAFGAYNSTQGISLERVIFSQFNRGFSVYGLPQTNLSWQADYIKVRECRFMYNRDAGIHTNIRNSNWKIEGTLFINPARQPGQAADSMHFERVGMVLIEDTFGGGFSNALGGTFIKILDSGPLTVINSQTESMTESFMYNEPDDPYSGDYSYPITFINSIFANPIVFKARRTFVSTGSLYGPKTFVAGPDLRVYSTGDRFCYDGGILGCIGGTKSNFGGATVVFMTAQPTDGRVQGHPTYFGTDVDFGGTVKMPSVPFRTLPADKPNGSMVYCPDCRRDTEPCRGGGSGAPAMVVNGRWSCL